MESNYKEMRLESWKHASLYSDTRPLEVGSWVNFWNFGASCLLIDEILV